MLTCSYCTYSTDRSYNLNRHIKTYHKLYSNNSIDIEDSKGEKASIDGEKTSMGGEKTSMDGEKTSMDGEKTSMDGEKTSMDFPNVTIELPSQTEKENINYTYNSETKKYECLYCYKAYVTKKGMSLHYCQKITDSCECPTCHKVFSSSSCKSRHMKKCIPKDVIIIPPKETTPVVPQASTVVNQHAENIHNNTNNVNSHNTNTNNIVVFHFDNDKPIPLQYDHITQQMIQQLFRGSYPMDGIREYAKKVLERPENLCVKKKHIRDAHSLVHVGDNKWESRVDQEVFPRLTYNISSNLLEYIEALQRRVHFSERLGEILNDVVSETNPHYKDIMRRIKLMVIDFTKSVLESQTESSSTTTK